MRVFRVLQTGFRDAIKSYSAGDIVHSAKDLVLRWGPTWFEFIRDLPESGDGNVPVPETSPLKETIIDVVQKVKTKRAGRPKKEKVVEETPPEDLQGE